MAKLEEALVIWIDLANKANHTVSGIILAQKAMDFAQKLNILNFKASSESIIFFIFIFYI